MARLNREIIEELLIGASDLSSMERLEFLGILSSAKDEDLEPLATLFVEDSSMIRTISENYKAKRAAFAGQDKTAWAAVLKQEEALLEHMANDE